MYKVLVVDDNYNIRKLICMCLEKAGYKTLEAADGDEALKLLENELIDLLIVDIMMPHMDGYTLTKELRTVNYDFPILMVTAKDRIEDKRKGFAMGTDDYMVKPINFDEMLMRVAALLRRAKINIEKKIVLGEMVLDYASLTVKMKTKEILLPQKEFYLLFKLLSYPKRIFTRHELMNEIWGYDSESDERTVDVHIKRLREKFSDRTEFNIVTIKGLGYKAEKNV